MRLWIVLAGLIFCSGAMAEGAAMLSHGKDTALQNARSLKDAPFVVDSRGCVQVFREQSGSVDFFPLQNDSGAFVCDRGQVGTPVAAIQFVADSKGCLHGVRELSPGEIETVRMLNEGGYPLCGAPPVPAQEKVDTAGVGLNVTVTDARRKVTYWTITCHGAKSKLTDCDGWNKWEKRSDLEAPFQVEVSGFSR